MKNKKWATIDIVFLMMRLFVCLLIFAIGSLVAIVLWFFGATNAAIGLAVLVLVAYIFLAPKDIALDDYGDIFSEGIEALKRRIESGTYGK